VTARARAALREAMDDLVRELAAAETPAPPARTRRRTVTTKTVHRDAAGRISAVDEVTEPVEDGRGEAAPDQDHWEREYRRLTGDTAP
jgi:hypothetical protein